MKLRERQIDDLHQMALYEYADSAAMVRRLNERYAVYVKYLVNVIRRAGRRRRK